MHWNLMWWTLCCSEASMRLSTWHWAPIIRPCCVWQDMMPAYLDTLITKLMALLRNGQKIVQEGALTAMASVADCAKSHFISFYGQVRCNVGGVGLDGVEVGGRGDDRGG